MMKVKATIEVSDTKLIEWLDGEVPEGLSVEDVEVIET